MFSFQVLFVRGVIGLITFDYFFFIRVILLFQGQLISRVTNFYRPHVVNAKAVAAAA